MLRYCTMRVIQAVEMIRHNSFKKLWNETVYFDREAVPVEMALEHLRPMEDFAQPASSRLIELKADLISGNAVTYPIRGRAIKAEYYLKQGYRGFAVVSGDAISGDIWCSTRRNPADGRLHDDEQWLKIRCLDGELYSFDMYVDPTKRGGNLAAILQNGALHELRKEGFTKAYGFFWADNIAALWVHRTLRWKELPRVRATRVIFSRKFSRLQ
jgi:GNAT superfamily N-acetyltransferase